MFAKLLLVAYAAIAIALPQPPPSYLPLVDISPASPRRPECAAANRPPQYGEASYCRSSCPKAPEIIKGYFGAYQNLFSVKGFTLDPRNPGPNGLADDGSTIDGNPASASRTVVIPGSHNITQAAMKCARIALQGTGFPESAIYETFNLVLRSQGYYTCTTHSNRITDNTWLNVADVTAVDSYLYSTVNPAANGARRGQQGPANDVGQQREAACCDAVVCAACLDCCCGACGQAGCTIQ